MDWTWLAGIGGALVAIAAAIKAFKELFKWLKPLMEMSDKFDQLEAIAERLDKMELHTERNYKALQQHIEQDRNMHKIICKSTLFMLRHMRTGNSVDELLDCENELMSYLSQK